MKTPYQFAIIALSLSACQPGTPLPPVPVPARCSDLGTLIEQTKIIDIHTHTFNSRFLPIREIALGKRDKLGRFLSIFAVDPATNLVTNTISAVTAYRERHLKRAIEYSDVMKEIRSSDYSEYGEMDEAEAYSNPTISGPCKLLVDHESDDKLTARERYHLRQFKAAFSEDEGLFPTEDKGANEIGHFLDCITTPREQLEARFHSDHGGKIALNASHMMDLAPVYDQEEDGALIPFRKQVTEMTDQQQKANGRMLYFVAYNPFRDHWNRDSEAHEDHSLEIVKNAYYHQGAFGVKVYPPSGYAPIGTQIKGPSLAISPQPCRQWNARYKSNGVKITGEELDGRMLKLFRWCAKENVPIFAHSGQGEVEARRGYHSFADPAGWRRLLEENSDLRDLRICLAHAGGDKVWFEDGKLTGWGRTVYELCRDYRNVYCEFGCEDSIADPKQRKSFSAQIRELIKESRNEQGSKSWNFSDKILYGSDWFMPTPRTSNRLNYLLAHQTAIYEAGGASLYKKYFLTNSLEFLNTRERIKKPGLPAPLIHKLD